MYVKIGPYKSWFGPFQLAETLLFWMDTDSDFVYKFGNWLAHRKFKIDLTNEEENHKTYLYKFMLWVDIKNKRKIKVKIDNYDLWSMDSTLAYIILPMLKKIKNEKHGTPFVDNQDVPEYLHSSKEEIDELNYEGITDEKFIKRWEWVLDEIIFSFESIVDDSWQDTLYEKRDFETLKNTEKRISNGLILFGKYYRSLWT
jgi:hypothetical protein